MKNIKLIAVSLLFVGLIQPSTAQFGYYNDALLFSQTQFNGTARIQGIGGAQVSLGGDISVANSNPAGLGFFNRSALTFTPAFDFHSTDTRYLGDNSTTFKNNFNFAQVGAVFNYSKGDIVQDKFKGGSFAVSLNRVNNFNNELMYDSRNNENSITDSFIQRSGTLFPDELGGFNGVAYDHFLLEEADYNTESDFIFQDENGDVFISPNLDENSVIGGYASLVGEFEGVLPRQNEVLRTSGSQYQLNLAWGGNYDDFFYFGGGVGINSLNYTMRRSYLETEYQFDDGTPDDLLNSISISDRLSINGTGINISFGGIIRPVDFVTIGVNYTSPTYYGLQEENVYTFETDWNPGFFYVAGIDTLEMGFIRTESDIFVSNYNLRTPAKLNLGASVFLSKYGFISADVEYIDYSRSQLKSNDFVVTEDNQAIRDIYQAVFNYRLGAEFRYEALRFRGGYNYMADPYKDNAFDRSRSSYSLGLGYRTKDYFVDLAIINSMRNSVYSPYELFDGENSVAPEARTDNQTTTVALTLGFIF